jgi:N-acetyl sugar amidotransferase
MTATVLDRQLNQLPKDIVFCRNCVVSNQRPRTEFNAQGICSACQWSYEKDFVVNWAAREQELVELLDKFRSRDGSPDVVVPSSGGKDSAFVAHQLKARYGMHPICATWAPFEWTDIGWHNLREFVNSGFFTVLAMQDGAIHRKLARLAFRLKGDAWEPFTFGQKSWAFHIAQKFGVKLIMYGENGELEYGGSTKYKNQPKEGAEEWEASYYKGVGVRELVRIGEEEGLVRKGEISPSSLAMYEPPHPDIITNLGLEMHWYSYYQKWTPQENFYYAAKHTGFRTSPSGRTECTYTKHASIDDKADGFHFYLGYMKFGLGRASRDAQTDIRRHHITREEGVRLVHEYDHEFPALHFNWFLEYLGINEEYFWEVMDLYRSKSNAWVKEYGNWKLKVRVS